MFFTDLGFLLKVKLSLCQDADWLKKRLFTQESCRPTKSSVWLQQHFQPQVNPEISRQNVPDFLRCEKPCVEPREWAMILSTPYVKQAEGLSERELPRHYNPPLLTQWQRSPHEEWPPLPCDGQGTYPPWPGQEEGWRGCSLGPLRLRGRWEEKKTVEKMGQMKQKRECWWKGKEH